MRNESHCFVEAHGRFVAAPDVQGYVVAVLLFCEGEDMLVKCGADVLSALGLVDAEVVDIECFYIGQDVMSDMLLEDTESVSQHVVFFVYCDKDRGFIIMDDRDQLVIRVFFCAVLEQVGASVVMDKADLQS